jgi:DNA-binding transcriptional MerR regulator
MAEKIYFKIGEVAERFKVNPSLIRYWEQEFSIIRPKKSDGGTRLFTRKDMDNFEIIHHLVKEKGMTIQGARDYIAKRSKDQSLEKLEVINTLKRTKAMLTEIRGLLPEEQGE